jgi:TIR domain
MLLFKKLPAILFTVIFLCLLSSSCNNDSEKSDLDISKTDSVAVMPMDSGQTRATNDNDLTAASPTDSAGFPERPAPVTTDAATSTDPEASIAYSYKNKMKKGDKSLIQMHVQLNKPLAEVVTGLQSTLKEQAIEVGSTDSSVIKSLSIAGAKYFHVSIDYDTAIFDIVRSVGDERQELKFKKPNKWVWRVTAKKETATSDIIINVKTEDEDGKIFERDNGILPIQITVDTPVLTVPLPLHQEQPFLVKYGWWIFSVAALVILIFIFLIWRKKRHTRELNSRIYFSYAWVTEMETIVDKLYESLKKDGFNVVRDKVNLKYKGLISNFMKDIGKSNIIIVALSDKYLKSRFCMFELFEIYRNCSMNKDEFCKKVFPIRENDINFSNPAVINQYIDFWNEEELKWQNIVKDKSEDISAEQFAQYEIVRRIANDIGNLLYFLSDINSLNVELLSKNDFEEIKSALRESLKMIEEEQ